MALTTQQVWEALEKAIFGVLGFTNSKGESRTAGVVYVVDARSLLISTARDAWKVRHIAADPQVSMTVTLPKRIPFMPFIKIPPATITFSGDAEILRIDDIEEEAVERLFHGLKLDRDLIEDTRIIRVVPYGEFVTYGIAMSVRQMRDTAKARGRAATGNERAASR